MARIRLTLEDDDGGALNGDKERRDNVSGGATRFVAIAAAVEPFQQAACPERTAEFWTLAQHQLVAEGKKGASGGVMGHGASPSRPCTGPVQAWGNGSRAPSVERRPLWSGPSTSARAPCGRGGRRAAPMTVTA